MYTGAIPGTSGKSAAQPTQGGSPADGATASPPSQEQTAASEQQAFAQALAQSLAQSPGDLVEANLLGGGLSGAGGLSSASGLSDSSLLLDLLGGGLAGAGGLSSASALSDSSLLPDLLGGGLSGAGGLSDSSLLPEAATAMQPPLATAASGYTSNEPAQSAIEPWVQQLAPAYGLSPSLVNAVIAQESGFNPSAVSSAGAMGLMQIMPATAASLGLTDPFDPVANLRAGMSYLASLVSRYNGDIPLALAAYNAGPEAVSRYGGIPPYPQTEQYVSDILSNWASQASTST